MNEPRFPSPVSAAEAAVYLPPEDSGSPTLRRALAGAAVVHALIFLAPLPTTTAEVAAPPEKVRLVLTQAPRWKRPEIPPEPVVLQPRTRIVPVPDPTPDDPEPIRPLVVDVPIFDEPDVVFFPDVAPPPLEPVQDGPFTIGGDVTRPVLLDGPKPLYPEIARRVRKGGVVVLQAIIDRDGRVTDLEVVKPGEFGLTEAALEAVARWRYQPARRRGEAVPVVMNVQVRFDLQ